MQSSTMPITIPQGLKSFLDKAIAPVTNKKCKIKDMTSFVQSIVNTSKNTTPEIQISTTVKILEKISISNENFIIRSFFPGIQLSQTQIDFLVNCVFVIRNQEGVYRYNHAQGERIRYEMKMGFLGLFLWVNYGVTFRIFSTENDHNIGLWETITVLPSYDIELIPPQKSDLSAINELLPGISKLAASFRLTPLSDMFLPTQRQKNLENTTLLNLHFTIQNTLSTLVTEVQNQIDTIFSRMLQEGYSQHVIMNFNIPASSNANLTCQTTSSTMPPRENMISFEDYLIDFLDDDYPRQVNESKNDESNIFSSSYDTNHVNNTLHEYSYFKSLFTKELLDIRLQKASDPYLNTYFNAFVYLALFMLSKQNEEWIAAASQYNVYKGGELSPFKNAALRTWFYGILAASNCAETEDLLTDSLGRINEIIRNHGASKWNFGNNAYAIPLQKFNAIFTADHCNYYCDLLQNASPEQLQQKILLKETLEKTTTQQLLKQLLSSTDHTPGKGILLRKLTNIIDTENEYKEFHHIYPATYLMPGIPIRTYQQQWKDKSGILIAVTPGQETPIIAFKRPAYSNLLLKSNHYLGFPHSASILRAQGGKPSYSVKEFDRRIRTIHLKHTSDFPDSNRKEFLMDLLLRHEKKYAYYSLKLPLALNATEIRLLKNQPFGEEKYESMSHSFQALEQFTRSVWEELSLYLNPADDIFQYYYSLIDELVQTSLNKKINFFSTLKNRIVNAGNIRAGYIRNNKYYPNQSIPNPHLELLAVGQKKYRIMHDTSVYASNEALVQGVISKPSEQKENSADYCYEELTTNEQILYILHQRHGNIPAVFANVFVGDTDALNISGIQDAVAIYQSLLRTRNQDIPLVSYHRGEFVVYSIDEFKNKFAESLLVVLPPAPPIAPPVSTTPPVAIITSAHSSTIAPTSSSTTAAPPATSVPIPPARIPTPIPHQQIHSTPQTTHLSTIMPFMHTFPPAILTQPPVTHIQPLSTSTAYQLPAVSTMTSTTSSSTALHSRTRKVNKLWKINRKQMTDAISIENLNRLIKNELIKRNVQGHIDIINFSFKFTIIDTIRSQACKRYSVELEAKNFNAESTFELVTEDKDRIKIKNAFAYMIRTLEKHVQSSSRYNITIATDIDFISKPNHAAHTTTSTAVSSATTSSTTAATRPTTSQKRPYTGGLTLFSTSANTTSSPTSPTTPTSKKTKHNPPSP